MDQTFRFDQDFAFGSRSSDQPSEVDKMMCGVDGYRKLAKVAVRDMVRIALVGVDGFVDVVEEHLSNANSSESS